MNIVHLSFIEKIQQFHFIRPYWLLMCLPALMMVILLLRHEKNNNAWQQYIDPALLAPLLQGRVNRSDKKLPLLSLLFWILCAFALAGPTWEKLPTPIEKRDTALVVLMDLSPSMLASDIKPSRLVAARHKIMDLLQLRKEGYTALIAYSGDAHIVAPLTDDTQTISNLLNVLEPGIMPSYGSNLEDALTQALQLFQNGGYAQGDILLVTDGVTTQTINNAAPILNGTKFTLSIIGVGTESGAPIPDNRGGFIKDKNNTIILPQLHEELLMALAQKVNGYYSPLQLNDDDIKPLADGTRFFNQDRNSQGNTRKSEREFDQWRDVGGILAVILLPLILIGFRRGVLVGFIAIIPLLHIPKVYAEGSNQSTSHISTWENLWLNDNQQAMKAMKNGDYQTAAKKFTDPNWKGAAEYEQGDPSSALKHFQEDSSSKGFYNQGNALAKSGQLEEAIHAYNQALEKNPHFDDAEFNKKIVQQLLEQQKQSQNQQQNPQEKDNSQSRQNENDNEKNRGQNGNQKNDKNSEPEKSTDQNPGDSKDQNRNEREKAREEQNKNDLEAQQKKSESGMDKNDSSGEEKPDDKNKNNNAAESKLTPEQKQALEQWLRQVPDDPSGLLRNKFEYYYQQRLRDQQAGKTDKRMNNEERW